MTQLSASTVIGRGSDFVATKVGEQTMMMSISAGKYFAVAETAQRIWELLEQPRSIEDIVGHLCKEYDVTEAACLEQVQGFADDLLANGLVTKVGDGQAA